MNFFKKKFESNDITIELTIDEIYKEFDTFIKKKEHFFGVYKKIEHTQLNSFPIAIVVLLEKLGELQNHKPLDLPDYKGNDLNITEYIELVNLMQSNILQKHSSVFRDIIENTNKLLFPQRYTEDIIATKRSTIKESMLGGYSSSVKNANKTGGGFKFTFNHLSLLRGVYNFNGPTFTKNVYAMMYSKDIIAKGLINEYMDYLLFTSISDNDFDFFSEIYKLIENNINMTESCEQLLNVKKYSSSSVKSINTSVEHLYDNKLTIELNDGKSFTIVKKGTLNFTMIHIILSSIQKLKKYYVEMLQDEIMTMNTRVKYSDLKDDIIQEFIDNYLSKLTKDPKYSIFLEILIFNTAYAYNIMHKALLNYYCPL
jgi:hypothetical protein